MQKIVAIMRCAQSNKILDVMERETQIICRGIKDYQTLSGVIGHGKDIATSMSKKFKISPEFCCSVPEFQIKLFTSMVDSLLDAVEALIG